MKLEIKKKWLVFLYWFGNRPFTLMRCNNTSCRAIHRRDECGYHFCINAVVPACPTCGGGVMNRMDDTFMKPHDGALVVAGNETTEDA